LRYALRSRCSSIPCKPERVSLLSPMLSLLNSSAYPPGLSCSAMSTIPKSPI
jgi:hypothetical protein